MLRGRSAGLSSNLFIRQLERKTMRNALRACAAAVLAAVPFLVQAQAAPAKPASDFTVTGNAGLFSDYRFRGFTQTGFKPAFQGGFDVAHSSGFYAGNWNSNVEQGLYNGASLEMDLYAGYKFSLADFGFDVGYLYYYYPNSGALGTTKIKNGELYLGASWGPVSAKYFYATTDFFSLGAAPTAYGTSGGPFDTSGSWYLDLTGTFQVAEGLTVVAHYGHQRVKNGRLAFSQGAVFDDADGVGDYRIGVNYDLSGWILGASYIGTTKKGFFRTAESGFTEDAGKGGIVVSVSKTF
jgi:uncharacterized protein (TIGR02001 family)